MDWPSDLVRVSNVVTDGIAGALFVLFVLMIRVELLVANAGVPAFNWVCWTDEPFGIACAVEFAVPAIILLPVVAGWGLEVTADEFLCVLFFIMMGA
jgi:hypothetical protein